MQPKTYKTLSRLSVVKGVGSAPTQARSRGKGARMKKKHNSIQPPQTSWLLTEENTLLSTMYQLESSDFYELHPTHTVLQPQQAGRDGLSMALFLFLLFCRKMKYRPCFPYIQYQYDSTQKLEGIKILIVINICGPPVLTGQPMGGGGEVSEAPPIASRATQRFWRYISCGWRHQRRSCCCCSWSAPSLCIS